MIFEIFPETNRWTIVGPTPEGAPHVVPNPLLDSRFRFLLSELRASASRPIAVDDPRARRLEDDLHALAKRISERLTPVLLSDGSREAVKRRMADADRRTRLVVRVRDAGPRGDLALALPWELLAPQPGTLAVHAGQLDVVREAVTDGAPELGKPLEPLKVAVTIAAPENQTALRYEEEAFRLYAALSSVGQRIAFADLGGVGDLIEVVAEEAASVIHFTGHGLPGRLVFEDETGLAETVEVAELVRRLRVALVKSGRAASFPRLFFLASCHGASGSRAGFSRAGLSREPVFSREVDEELAPLLEDGPSTAAVLHRSGFVQVVGYFGPVGDALSTRAEEAFYSALARCETTLEAVTEARATLDRPLEDEGVRVRYPLGWAQLALYHRGPDLPLAVPGEPAAPPRRRQTMDVSGLPVLKHGFIGRRADLHRIRRKVKGGQNLIVLQGLGGLGKTALASHLLTQVFASDPRDRLILRCQGLENDAHPIEALRVQAEKHGEGLPGWEERSKELREQIPDPVAGFAEVVRHLRRERPHLVIYADNLEALQSGPKTEETGALGSWRAGAEEWWEEMENLADGGLVLASTRYAWKGLDPDSWVGIEPMGWVDTLRLIESFDTLAKLPRDVRMLLARMVDGHPRTVEYLDALVNQRRHELGLGYDIEDVWEDLIEPILPAHEGKLSADLLLSEIWRRLSERAREHAGRLIVLRVPAPRDVINVLGGRETTNELIETSLLGKYSELIAKDGRTEWIARWGFHSLVSSFVASQPRPMEEKEVHTLVGRAYVDFLERSRARRADQAEAIHHLHAAKLGDESWTLTQEYVLWLRLHARYQEGLDVLANCATAGVTGDGLAGTLFLAAQIRYLRGERGPDLHALLAQALSLAEEPLQRAEIIAFQGTLLEAAGDLENAEARLQQAQRKFKEALPPEHPVRASVLNELARVRIVGERPEEAEPMLREALSILEKTIGTDDPEYANVLNTLVAALVYQGKDKEVERLLRQVIEIQERVLGGDHPSLSAPLTSLARVYSANGRAEEGERLAERALDIRRQIGEETPDVAIILSILARTRSAQRKPEAVETARQALELFDRLGMTGHASVQSAMTALEGIVKAGVTVEDRMLALNPRIESAADRAELATAISLQEGLVDLVRPYKTRDGQLSLCLELRHLAGLKRRAGLHEEALRLLEEAVILGESVDHPSLEALRADLRFEEITIGLMKHLEEGGFDPDPVGVARFRESDDQSRKAWEARERGDFGEAARRLEKAIELLRQVGDGHALKKGRLRDFLFGLADLYSQTGRHGEAVAALEEATAVAEEEKDENLEVYREALRRASERVAEV